MWRPILAGVWRHIEVIENKYSFLDLLDIHEMLDVKETNERLFSQYQESLATL